MNANTERTEIVGALALFLLEKTGSIFGDFQGRITADEQRKHFGCAPFGKCRVMISGDPETVRVSRKVAFGQDFEATEKSWLQMEQEINAGIHPFSLGRYAKRFTEI